MYVFLVNPNLRPNQENHQRMSSVHASLLFPGQRMNGEYFREACLDHLTKRLSVDYFLDQPYILLNHAPTSPEYAWLRLLVIGC